MPQKFSTLQYVVDGFFFIIVIGYMFKLMKGYKPKIHAMTIEEAKDSLYKEIKEIPNVSGISIKGKGKDPSIVVYFDKEPNLKEALKIPLNYHGYYIKTKIIGKIKTLENGKK